MKKRSSNNTSINTDKLDSIIYDGIYIEGKLVSTGSVRVDCKIHGRVESDTLYIGDSGYINGDVFCKNIVVAGKVDGNIYCSGKMYIKSTGIIIGDITVDVLSMDEGATFEGKCIKNKEKQLESIE